MPAKYALLTTQRQAADGEEKNQISESSRTSVLFREPSQHPSKLLTMATWQIDNQRNKPNASFHQAFRRYFLL